MDHRVILIESNRTMLERLSSVIKATEGFDLSARYQEAADALGQGGLFQPNIILLDIDTPSNRTLIPSFVEAFPEAVVLCTSESWSAEGSADVIKAGAKGYLIKPFTNTELAEAAGTFGRQGMSAVSDVLAFFSPKGRSGKTTLIASLALALARQSNEAVGIIDADLQFADMAAFFDLAPISTLVEAVRDIHFLSPVTLATYFLPVSDKVQVLCGPKKPSYAEMVTHEALANVVRMARGLFRYVLIDLPAGFCPISMGACEMADTTFMVSMMASGREVHHMQRALDIFRTWPDYANRLKTIFIRVNPCNEQERQRLGDALGYPVSCVLPNEYHLVTAANSGRMAQGLKGDTLLSRNIDQLAKDIARTPSATVAPIAQEVVA